MHTGGRRALRFRGVYPPGTSALGAGFRCHCNRLDAAAIPRPLDVCARCRLPLPLQQDAPGERRPVPIP